MADSANRYRFGVERPIGERPRARAGNRCGGGDGERRRLAHGCMNGIGERISVGPGDHRKVTRSQTPS